MPGTPAQTCVSITGPGLTLAAWVPPGYHILGVGLGSNAVPMGPSAPQDTHFPLQYQLIEWCIG